MGRGSSATRALPASVVGGLLVCGLLGCAAATPRNIDDGCAMFANNRSWYRAASRAEKRWHVPISVQLAIVYQESRFQARARAPRRKFLWVLPGPRPSTAYGYTQALTVTWKEYIRATGNRGADRDDFGDAVDFIGWYADRSHRRLGIAKNDAYRVYLAYHEGDGGFERRSYAGKPWLLRVASKVRTHEMHYRRQLESCRGRLEQPWWVLF